ncbi:hypothetical protein SARC_02986 [Sphaeroforma arctica JP610]|uniref:Helicase-associated domain-containing protein n=1 Tax=Sphaeroforma arctica JP610 TaxID=667725 RepID=A0A0L0G7E8_9EUKA|nr:hypothetical protein SARC_02986 [Sphaeroforma arctica JP610]KNC84811.1 hypothetical protein SARC_02986 [Sphaeroforma arctica JP610]|eukprot:XP_014158713.1 hypothetical protein SARC_02986 [Sphaeroforma arctica JP610]
MDEDFDKLVNLQVVSKVCTELENHLGYSDNTLAEFLISLVEEKSSAASFHAALSEMGGEFTETFSGSLYRLINKLKPKPKKNDADDFEAAAEKDEKDEKRKAFPGLALQDEDPELTVALGCSEEILTVVAMLSIQNVFYRPKEKQADADAKRAKFFQPEGDHLTLLAVYNSWKQNKFSNMWCHENFIQARTLRRAQDVRKQMLGIMDRYKLDVLSAGMNFNLVRKCIVSGFFRNAAKKDPQEGYKTLVEQSVVYIHPSSALFNRQPEWVVYHDLVLTTKEYMREVTAVEPQWFVEFAPAFFKVGDPTRMSKAKRQQRIEPLFNKYEEPNSWRISKTRMRRN